MASKRDIQGRVEGVNDNGVKIDGTWYNFSNFFEGERSPAKGVAVSAVIDNYKGKEYLCKLVVIGSALPGGGNNGPVSQDSEGGSRRYRSSETNERIARQVALKAAVDFQLNKGGNEADVAATARIFEQFLSEPYGQGDVEDAA